MRGAGSGSRSGPSQAEIYDGTFRSDEEAVSYFYALKNDHLPDFENPTWINEKVRWQFLNQPNPLMSLAADKIARARLPALQGRRVRRRRRCIATGSTRRGAVGHAACRDASR